MTYAKQLTLYMEWLWSFDVRARDENKRAKEALEKLERMFKESDEYTIVHFHAV